MKILLLLFAVSIIQCGKKSDTNPPFTVRLLNSSAEGYAFRDVQFSTLIDLDNVRGTLAEIKGSAVLDLEDDVTEIIGTENPDAIYSHRGYPVDIDYIVEGDVIYPKDFSSMAALSMYHNFERTFLFWQDFANLDLQDFGYTTIYNNPRLKAKSDGISIEAKVKVNAAFLTGVRDLWFFQKSKIAKVPIKMNFGVMAHEFSHSLFDLIVADKDPSFYNGSYRNEHILSAINEGIADFFSILVTGRTEEFGESLEALGRTRTPPVSWTYSNAAQSCDSSFYCEGSVLNSALYEAAQDIGMETTANYVYAALPKFGSDWLDTKDSSSFDFHVLINRILDEASTEHQTILCQSMTKWFDSISEKFSCL